MDEFAPFFYLWDTAQCWDTSYQLWMNDPFDSLNATLVDNNVNGWWKGLLKTFREFQKRELVSQAISSEFIRSQVIYFYVCIYIYTHINKLISFFFVFYFIFCFYLIYTAYFGIVLDLYLQN